MSRHGLPDAFQMPFGPLQPLDDLGMAFVFVLGHIGPPIPLVGINQ